MSDDPMAQLPVAAPTYDGLPGDLELGAFSISLSVADLSASEAFYGKLGFERTGGDGESWVILANGESLIGLFPGLLLDMIQPSFASPLFDALLRGGSE